MSVSDQIEWGYHMINELVGHSGYNVEESTSLLYGVVDDMLRTAAGRRYSSLRASLHHFRENVPTVLTFLTRLYETFERRTAAEGVDHQLIVTLYEMRRYYTDSVKYGQEYMKAWQMAGYNRATYDKAVDLLNSILKYDSFRASSMVENLNGRFRDYGDAMCRDPKNRNELIRLRMDTKELKHTRVKDRLGKSPIERALGQKVDFYDLLGIKATTVLTLTSY